MKMAQVVEWALKTLTSIAFALACWCLLEVVQLKGRVSVVETTQSNYKTELVEIEKTGSPGFRTHDLLDQQRDLELRNRIARAEVAMDKITTAMEQIAVIANDVKWLKENQEKAKP